jgi:hypothetical protein
MLASSECRYNKDDFLHAVKEFKTVLSEGNEQRKLSCLELELIKARAHGASLTCSTCRLEHVCCCCARSIAVCP